MAVVYIILGDAGSGNDTYAYEFFDTQSKILNLLGYQSNCNWGYGYGYKYSGTCALIFDIDKACMMSFTNYDLIIAYGNFSQYVFNKFCKQFKGSEIFVQSFVYDARVSQYNLQFFRYQTLKNYDLDFGEHYVEYLQPIRRSNLQLFACQLCEYNLLMKECSCYSDDKLKSFVLGFNIGWIDSYSLELQSLFTACNIPINILDLMKKDLEHEQIPVGTFYKYVQPYFDKTIKNF